MKRKSLSILPLLLVLAACVNNPLTTAQTNEQKGDALYGTYVIHKEQGAVILQNPQIADEAKRPLAQAMVDSKPVADGLQDTLIEYSAVKAQIDQGTTPQERLEIVDQHIGEWIDKATPLINKLVAAVGALLK
jgi:hypothetical protein